MLRSLVLAILRCQRNRFSPEPLHPSLVINSFAPQTAMQTAASFIAEAWAELAIGICFIILRLYFRYSQVGLRGMMLDDYLMILAGVRILSLLCRSTSNPSCSLLVLVVTRLTQHYIAGLLHHRNPRRTPDRRRLARRREQQFHASPARRTESRGPGVPVCGAGFEGACRGVVVSRHQARYLWVSS